MTAPVLVIKCPHCLADNMTMRGFGFTALETPDTRYYDGNTGCLISTSDERGVIGLYCSRCAGSVSGSYIANAARMQNIFSAGSSLDAENITLELWPKPQPSTAPKYTPAHIAAIFVSALETVKQARGEDAAGARHMAGLGLGKALEMSLREFDPSVTGMLAARIHKLSENGKLPGDLSKWCSGLKAMRNDAAHEDEPLTYEELDDFAKAIELIIMYLFTLPGTLAEYAAKP